jgi:hypothetical protein
MATEQVTRPKCAASHGSRSTRRPSWTDEAGLEFTPAVGEGAASYWAVLHTALVVRASAAEPGSRNHGDHVNARREAAQLPVRRRRVPTHRRSRIRGEPASMPSTLVRTLNSDESGWHTWS